MMNLPPLHTTPQSSEEANQFCADVMAKLDAFESILAQETAHIAAALCPHRTEK